MKRYLIDALCNPGRGLWMLMAVGALGVVASWAAAQTSEDSAEEECWAALRQYARHFNEGDLAAAYQMFAPPLYDLMSETDFREFVTFELFRGAQSEEQKELQSELGQYQNEIILTVEKPEVHGRDAIAGIIVGTDLTMGGRWEGMLKLRDPEFVRLSGVPTWGEQLELLGISLEDCDLAEDFEARLGDPESSYSLVDKKWIVASLDKEGQWRVWPPMHAGRILAVTHNVGAREARYNFSKHGGELEGEGPFIFPKPSLTELTYVKWFTVETDPARCPKCEKYVQGNWEYCPYDGAKLKEDEPTGTEPNGTAGEEPKDDATP